MAEKIPEPLLARLSEFVTARMGLHFPPEKWRDLERNMRAVATEFGFENVTDCVQWLLSSELTRSQMETLASHLTVGETYFFREKQIFEILQERIIPEWIGSRRGAQRRLRIWSAGCCSGEEPYSLAIFLSKAIPDWKDWNITILATDINPRFLRTASRGIYNEWSFRDTPSWVKHGCFRRTNHDGYEILPKFKERITFAHLNLADDVYPSLLNNTNAMDLIFCRNVLMYFSDEQARKVIGHFHSALVDGGWLVVSATETSPVLYRQFASVNLGGFTFYKKAQGKTQVPEPSFRRETISPIASAETNPPSRIPAEVQESPTVRKSPEPATHAGPSTYDEALVLYEAGRYSEVTEKLAPADIVLSDANAAVLLARTYANLGKLDEALGWCDKAIAREKMNPELHYLRATILQEQGNVEASIAALKRALYLDPEFVLAHFALGNLALRRDEFDEADKQFKNALLLLKRSSPETVLPGSEGLTSARLSEILRATMLQEKGA